MNYYNLYLKVYNYLKYMANIEEAFNAKFENVTKVNNHSDIIDYFFTQRKVTEYEEILDKNMNRIKKKKDNIYNFIAINVPHYQYVESTEVIVGLKIWGDECFKYVGSITNIEGNVPSILLKLDTDKQLFINLKVRIKKGEEMNEKEYVTFINIPKRYQVEPSINVDI